MFYLNKTTERSDVLASSLYEGKVAIIVAADKRLLSIKN
ncbi:spore germination protein [Bacillus sp. F19]|nr:spore germination protein [Bacillus sp. F19]